MNIGKTQLLSEAPYELVKMTVYHGSYLAVEKPQILAHKRTKDFGTGFYCTLIREQAERWARRYSTPCVNKYILTPKPGLKVQSFQSLTDEWLDFVVCCRSGVRHQYDIVIGAMVDNQIYNYVNDFIDGIITREQLWTLAKFKHPTQQICFCTPKGLDCLTFLSEASYERL